MDTFCLKTGIHGIPSPISVGGATLEVRVGAFHVSAVGRDKSTAADTPPQKTGLSSRFSFMYPLQSLWPGGGKSNRCNGTALDNGVLAENGETARSIGGDVEEAERENRNWVLKILHVRSLRREEEVKRKSLDDEDSEREGIAGNGGDESNDGDKDEEECDARRVNYDDEKSVEFDKESFARLLKRVSLAEAKLYAQMCYLGNLAYCITKIKPAHLLKYRGLRFVTSSIEKRELASKVENSEVLPEAQETETGILNEAEEVKEQKNNGYRISASAAYEIAASATSYLHSHTKSILPFKSSKTEGSKESPEGNIVNGEKIDMMDPDVASFMATTDSVTAVVAAKEEVKQAVADDLSSTHSSPCEWFICDDDQATRYFVIQGSESLASWQANLLFEPVEFEGLDVFVHRGIYEAAKGMFEQMLPEVHSHLKSHGRRATFRCTGHSLGGSLSLLINLMLLIRGEAPPSSLLPVITFGAPSVMCGGDLLLRKLGLPRSHVQAITMHRDIVPRAFSCNYPNHVAELLKAVNGRFRSHPCLNNQKLLYAPMGELLLLQPDEKFSPSHDLLPSGSGLYFLSCSVSDDVDAEKQLRAAQTVFLNSPHPLEILSDRSAYGSGGSIQRDHDMNSYLKSVRSVIRQELNRIRRTRRELRCKFWWSVLAPHGTNGSAIPGRSVTTINIGQNQFNFAGVLQIGKESLKRLTRLVASQHMHLLVVLLFPACLLLLGVTSTH